MENNNNRIIGIDILKVFAVLLVLNSHMSMCYDGIEHPFWVTGEGAIGNALFFFSSGFTLFLGDKQLPSFANWYKRRVNRIIPTILSVVIIVCIFRNFSYVMRYWFVECILVYYVFFYPIRRFSFLSNHLNRVFMGAAVAILLIYLLAFNYTNKSLFYGHDDFRRYFFFLYMLQGAIMGKQYALYKFKGWHVLMLFVCVAVWYALCIVFKNSQWQIITAIPLFGISYCTYLVSCAPFFKRLYDTKWLGNALFIVSSLCLEVYLIQFYLITDNLNYMFPLNIPIIMIVVLVAAYIAKMFSDFISQTFKDEPYNWGKMILYKR